MGAEAAPPQPDAAPPRPDAAPPRPDAAAQPDAGGVPESKAGDAPEEEYESAAEAYLRECEKWDPSLPGGGLKPDKPMSAFWGRYKDVELRAVADLRDAARLDRALMKIKELLGGAAPVGGQITVAMHVDELPTAQAVRDLFEPVAAKHERFHKVPDHVGKYMWECTFKEAALANEELPEGRPLWRFELLEGSDGKAVVMRVNHVTGDGLRLLKIGNKVLEFEDGSPATIAALEKMSKNKDKTWADKPSKFSILCDVLTAATMSLLPNETSDAFHAPGTIFDGAAPRAHVLRATVPLADVLAIRSRLAAGATLNDVILTAFCGAARNYASTTYNDFVMPSTKLPVFVEDRGRRLAEVQASMRALKKSRAGFIQAVIVAIFEKFGLEKLAGGAQRDVFAKHSLVYSNLPGYEKPVFFAKSKIAKFGVFFPNMISQVAAWKTELEKLD
ncbi:DUF1298-containing protein [Aureococcus anophagefferens]|nr:DUF1298-containing protein [Aureococcus anophagefferens]